jgi:hypothetical protein
VKLTERLKEQRRKADEADEEGRRRIEEYNASVKAGGQLPAAPGTEQPSAPPATQSTLPAALTGLAGLAVVVGSIMPWASIATAFGTVSVAGTEGDGKITLALGVGLLILAAVQISNANPGLRLFSAIVGAGTGVVAVIDIANVSSKVGEVSSAFARASVGSGLYVVLVGGALAIIGAVAGGRKAS